MAKDRVKICGSVRRATVLSQSAAEKFQVGGKCRFWSSSHEELAMAYAILRSQATDGYDSGGLTVAWVAQIRMKNFSNPGLSNWRIG